MINVTSQYPATCLSGFAETVAVCAPRCLNDSGVTADTWSTQVFSEGYLLGNPHVALIAKWRMERDLTPAEVARLNSVLTDYPADEVRGELAEELRWIMGDRKLAMLTPLTVEDVRQARHAVEAGLTPFVVPDVS